MFSQHGRTTASNYAFAMAVFTEVSESQAQDLLYRLNLGELSALRGIGLVAPFSPTDAVATQLQVLSQYLQSFDLQEP